MSTRDLTILGSSSQQPTRHRNHGAYLLRWNECGFLFDPGEGTQRQFIYANISPTCVTHILISHFHGDHSLGLGSMFMRLNLDKIKHPIHCFYPSSGKIFFDRLRFGSVYRNNIEIIEHAIEKDGVVYKDNKFTISGWFLNHGIDSVGYRVEEKDQIKFYREKLSYFGLSGPKIKKLHKEGSIVKNGKTIYLKDVCWVRKGDIFSIIMDTRICENAYRIAEHATILVCESTFLESEKGLAYRYKHLTAKEAASIAKDSGVHKLVLTHFSARYVDLCDFYREACVIFKNTVIAVDFKKIPFLKGTQAV